MFRVGLFIPIYFREELVKDCMNALANSVYNFRDLEVFLALGINGARKSFMDEYLPEYISRYEGNVFEKIYTFDLNENIGKPRMINYMSDRCGDYDYLVSIDSDMVTEDRFWLAKMLYIFGNYVDIKPLGCLCSNQSGHNVHMVSTYQVIKKQVREFTLLTTPANDGVAGGVLMTPKVIWDELGGYRAFNMYGSDDGHYARDCFKNGLVMAYVDQIYFYHPSGSDTGYADWKGKAVSNALDDEHLHGFYEYLRGE